MITRLSWRTVLHPVLVAFVLHVGAIALAGELMAKAVTQTLLLIYAPSGPPPAAAKVPRPAGSEA